MPKYTIKPKYNIGRKIYFTDLSLNLDLEQPRLEIHHGIIAGIEILINECGKNVNYKIESEYDLGISDKWLTIKEEHIITNKKEIYKQNTSEIIDEIKQQIEEIKKQKSLKFKGKMNEKTKSKYLKERQIIINNLEKLMKQYQNAYYEY